MWGDSQDRWRLAKRKSAVPIVRELLYATSDGEVRSSRAIAERVREHTKGQLSAHGVAITALYWLVRQGYQNETPGNPTDPPGYSITLAGLQMLEHPQGYFADLPQNQLGMPQRASFHGWRLRREILRIIHGEGPARLPDVAESILVRTDGNQILDPRYLADLLQAMFKRGWLAYEWSQAEAEARLSPLFSITPFGKHALWIFNSSNAFESLTRTLSSYDEESWQDRDP